MHSRLFIAFLVLNELKGNLLTLQQQCLSDPYGNALLPVSSFDSFNHIPVFFQNNVKMHTFIWF